MRGDPLDISARFGQLVKKFKMDVEHFPQWTDAEKKPLAEVVGRAIRHTQKLLYWAIDYDPQAIGRASWAM